MMRLDWILNIVLILVAGVGFSGCAFKSQPVNKPLSEIMADKEKAYVVFSRPSNLVGAAGSIDIIQFDNKNFKLDYVAYLSNGERVIYSIDEGENYFYTNTGISEFMEVLNAKKGHVYYVDLGVNMNTALYPLIYTEQRLKLLEELKKQDCSERTLSKYGFKGTNKNMNGSYTSDIQVTIECKNNEVIGIRDEYLRSTINELDEVDLVEPNENAYASFENYKSEFTKDIKDVYSIWNIKLRDVPMSESPFIKIINKPNDEVYKKFTDVNIIHVNNKIKLDEDIISSFDNKLKAKLDHKKKSKEILTLECTFDKYDNGNMASRYFATGFDSKSHLTGLGVLDLRVRYLTSTGEEVGAIKISVLETSGIFGGFNTMEQDLIQSLSEYTKMNYLKI